MIRQVDPNRLLFLDVLRACAVLLVLGRHLPPLVPAAGVSDGLWLDVLRVWWRGGWIGVDLFFVLSGFLVSGLLLREFEQHGRLRIGHFLMRRGLKIYPAFYLMIGLTAVLRLHQGSLDGKALICELLFVQNYGPALWNHTWSLAVEEHFYLLLALLFLALTHGRSRPREAFAALPRLTLWVATFCLALRITYGLLLDYSDRTHLYATVLRLDALMFGVLLSTWFHLHREAFQRFCSRHRRWLFFWGVAFLVPPFVWQLEETPFVYTVGLTLLYLGSGMLLCSRLVPASAHTRLVPVLAARAVAALAWIGTYSYSIYLWHMPVRHALDGLYQDGVSPLNLSLYLAAAIATGIVMARLIEIPVLVLRDRWLPSRSRSLDSVGSGRARPSAPAHTTTVSSS